MFMPPTLSCVLIVMAASPSSLVDHQSNAGARAPERGVALRNRRNPFRSKEKPREVQENIWRRERERVSDRRDR
jgi:hypothetical protein